MNTYIATEIQHGFLTNADEFLGRMTFDDWKSLKPIWQSQIDDGAFRVHPTFCTLAKAAWWNGSLALLWRSPDIEEAGPDAREYLKAVEALDVMVPRP